MAQNLWKTSRLAFRAVETSDEPFLTELNTHPQNLVNAAHFLPHPQNQKDIHNFREFLEAALVGVLICLLPAPAAGHGINTNNNNNNPELPPPPPPQPIGALTLSQDPRGRHHRVAGIGINILPQHTGKGYGSEAIRWALEYSFLTIGLHRVEIGCFEFNTGAIQLYRRLHFVDEGFKRQSIFSQGKWWGQYQLGMLEDEWRALRETGAL